MPSARPDVASKSNRLVAFGFDVVMVGMAYWFLAYAAERLSASLDESLTFAVVFFGYQLFFLRWNDGASFGKSLRGICVISASGTRLSSNQAVIRALVLTLPFALLAAQDILAALLYSLPDARYLAILPSILWWLVELYFVESDQMGQSLTDRISKSLVVNVPPPQPHRAPAVPMHSATDREFGPRPKLPSSNDANSDA
jgi:uncharacterized RDD family membrane protein YckC